MSLTEPIATTSGLTEKLLLTPEEAARRLGLSRTHIFRLIATKQLRSIKIGRLRRISRGALDEFVAQSERDAIAS
jgi:excisionase family DNA binding protein